MELPSTPPRSKKQQRRATPMAVRAERAGVTAKLHPLPDPPHESASNQEVEDYKKRLGRCQIANQQIVARAEASLAKKAKK